LQRLVGQLPTKAEAVRLLLDRAQAYFDRKLPLAGEVGGQIELWRWDAGKKQCVPKSYPSADAARALAARLARDAFALSPDDPQVRLLYLATMFEEAAYENQLQPLEDREGSVLRQIGFGAEAVEGVLQWAMEHGHPAAATVAAQALGQLRHYENPISPPERSQFDQLLMRDGSPTPLVRALQYPDRRLRIAAAEAIVRLNPTRPYAGSSCLPDALAFFAASAGQRRALSAAANTELGRSAAGFLAAEGFQVDTATSGREVMLKAVASPDYELASIDVSIAGPTIDLLLQQLRRDPRTADLRVGLMARAGFFEQAERVAKRHALTLDFARPHNERDFRWEMEQLATLGPREFVGHEERQRHAETALSLLGQLAEQKTGLYDLRRAQPAVLAALYNPPLQEAAIAVLANLGTREGQLALVELASRSTQPIEARRAAVAAVATSCERHGILLTAAEMKRQYDRYNQSAELDAAAQQVLARVLDVLEAGGKGEGGTGKAEESQN